MIKGSCLCGQVTFTIEGAVTNSRYCHCDNCRKFSGTAQAAWGLARTADFSLSTQPQDVRKYDAGAGGVRSFCGHCGSPLWFEPKDMPAFIGIALGTVDEGEVTPPEMHLWVQSSPAWETITGNLPCFTSVPDTT